MHTACDLRQKGTEKVPFHNVPARHIVEITNAAAGSTRKHNVHYEQIRPLTKEVTHRDVTIGKGEENAGNKNVLRTNY
jgi:hypothetical protein